MRRIATLVLSALLAVTSVAVWPAARIASALSVLHTDLISAASNGDPGDAPSGSPVISSDGRYVAFNSTAQNLTADPVSPNWVQAFLYDRQTHTMQLISKTADGTIADQGATAQAISNDGRYVVLSSSSTNFPGYVTPPAPLSSTTFMYILDRQSGALTHIGDSSFINVNAYANNVSSDGNIISYSAMTGYDAHNSANVTAYYIYNRTTGVSTQLPAECGAQSVSGDGRYTLCITQDKIELYTIATGARREILSGYAGTNPMIYLSRDGTRALLTSRDPAGNGNDLTVENLDSGQITTLQTGINWNGMVFLSMSADNRYATYETDSFLSPGVMPKEGWVIDTTTGQKLRVIQSYGFTPQSITADGTQLIYVARPISGSQSAPPQIYATQINEMVPPTVTGTPDRAANAAGWYNGDVTVHWTATDPDPSSGTPTQPSDTLASLEGAHTYASGQSCDPAGNCATGSVTLKIDKSAPTISASKSPAANAAGWNNSNVTVTFNCGDSVSGVQSCTAPVTVSTEGASQTATGTATDLAGNTATTTATVKLDKTAPTVSAPTMSNTFFLFGGSANVSANAADALSGVSRGEYYIDTDPGQGHGTALTYANGKISGTVTIPSNLSFGTHHLYMRTLDAAGNWSGVVSVTFTFI
jgi:hypothetical protein